MKGLGYWCLGVACATTGVWGLPFTPYTAPQFGGAGTQGSTDQGLSIKLKRSIVETDVHPLIARAQAGNRAYKKYAPRLNPPVKRDAYSEVLNAHNEILRRGEEPGTAHLMRRAHHLSSSGTDSESESSATPTTTFGFLQGETPTISPAVALDEDGQDITYFAEIGLGSNQKQFFVVMDSGSSDLWVPSANCQDRACVVHNRFGSNDSSTLDASSQTWQITYGSGSAAGVLVADSVTIANLTVNRMPFGVATQLSNFFALNKPDGILGLALDKANAQGVPTVMDQLKNNNLISQKLIGVNLQRASDNVDDGEISFGIIDTSKFTGKLTTVPNVGTTGLWEVPLDDAVVGGQALGFQNKTSITDTGTTLIIIPPDDAVTLHNAIPNAVTDGQGNFAFPCDTNTEISLVFGGQAFSISPKDYVGSPLQDGQGDNLCNSNIMGQQVGTANQWLVGDVFLKNVYTVFDYDTNQVAFGQKATVVGSSNSTGNNQLLKATSAGFREQNGMKIGLICMLSGILGLFFIF